MYRVLVVCLCLAGMIVPVRANAQASGSALIGLSGHGALSAADSALVDATISSLTGANVALTGDDLNAISLSDIGVGALVDQAKQALGTHDDATALATALPIDAIVDMLAAAKDADNDPGAASSLRTLATQLLPATSGHVAIGELLHLGLGSSEWRNTRLPLFDVIMGYVSLVNYHYGQKPVHALLSGATLGLGKLIKDIDLAVAVVEPPVIGIGPVGVTAQAAGARVAISAGLADAKPVSVDASLLSGAVSANITLDHMAWVGTNIDASGVIDSIDADSGDVLAHATAGRSALYLGVLSDDALADKSGAVDLVAATGPDAIATVHVSALGLPVDVKIGARGYSSADSDEDSLSFPGGVLSTQDVISEQSVPNLLIANVGNLVSITIGDTSILQLSGRTVGAVSKATHDLLVGDHFVGSARVVVNGVLDKALGFVGSSLGRIHVSVGSTHAEAPSTGAGNGSTGGAHDGSTGGDVGTADGTGSTGSTGTDTSGDGAAANGGSTSSASNTGSSGSTGNSGHNGSGHSSSGNAGSSGSSSGSSSSSQHRNGASVTGGASVSDMGTEAASGIAVGTGKASEKTTASLSGGSCSTGGPVMNGYTGRSASGWIAVLGGLLITQTRKRRGRNHAPARKPAPASA